MEDTVLKLDLETMAQTAYRAFQFAAGQEPRVWDGLSLEDQTPWLKLAKKAEHILTHSEGESFSQVWRKMFWAAFDECRQPEGAAALPWQALTRHLYAIVDEYDIPDLQALERSWGEWVAKRRTS